MLAKMKAAADGTFAKLEQKVDEKMAQVDQRIDKVATVVRRLPSKPLAAPAPAAPAALAPQPPPLSQSASGSAGGSMPAVDLTAAAKAFEHVPKGELISLLAKTNGRCKQLEMRLAELKTLHVAMLEEKRQLVATKGRAGGNVASERDSIEVTLRQEYEDRLAELEEQVTSSGSIKKQLQMEVGRLTSDLQGMRASLTAAEADKAATMASREQMRNELHAAEREAKERVRRAESESSAVAAEQASLRERVLKLQEELSAARVSPNTPSKPGQSNSDADAQFAAARLQRDELREFYEERMEAAKGSHQRAMDEASTELQRLQVLNIAHRCQPSCHTPPRPRPRLLAPAGPRPPLPSTPSSVRGRRCRGRPQPLHHF